MNDNCIKVQSFSSSFSFSLKKFILYKAKHKRDIDCRVTALVFRGTAVVYCTHHTWSPSHTWYLDFNGSLYALQFSCSILLVVGKTKPPKGKRDLFCIKGNCTLNLYKVIIVTLVGKLNVITLLNAEEKWHREVRAEFQNGERHQRSTKPVVFQLLSGAAEVL